MLGNFSGLVVLIALVVLFGWLAKRAWGSKRAGLKWAGVVLASLLTLLLALVTVIALIGFFKVYLPPQYAAPQLKVAGTPEQIARGQQIVGVTCTGCHSTNGQLPLSGGKDMAPDIGLPVGTIVPYNLTPGGPLRDWTDGDIWRAIREGVDPNGRTLVMMNAIGDPRFLSDDDLQAVIAYLRSQPAVQNEPPQEGLSLVGLLLVGAGLVPGTPPVTGTVTAPPQGPTVAYGKYVVDYIGCRGCHGENLTGNTGLGPHGPNLTVVVPKWSQDQFVQYIRGGTNPDMQQYTRMEDVELAAVYQYLHGLTPTQK